MISCFCNMCLEGKKLTYFEFDKLTGLYENGHTDVVCTESYEKIRIAQILGDILHERNESEGSTITYNYYNEEVNHVKNQVKIGNNNQHTQVNLAGKNSSIYACQSGRLGEEFESAFKNFREHLSSVELSDQEKEEVIELIEGAKEETEKEKPKRSIIKSATQKIEEVIVLLGSAEKIKKVAEPIVEFFNTFLP